MRRLLALGRHALGALDRRRSRSVALIIALAVTTASASSIYLLSESLRVASDALAADAPALTVQRLVAGRPALMGARDAEALRALPTVRSVEERVWGYLYQPALEGNVVVIGVSADRLATLGEDLSLDTHGLAADEVVVGSVLSDALGLRPGDRLALVPSEGGEHAEPILVLRVRGVLPPRTAQVHGDAVLASPATARLLLGMAPDEVVDLAIEVFPPEEAGVVAARALELVSGARVIERETLSRRRALTFQARAGLLSATLLPLLLSMLLMAFDRLSGLGEAERREIGILKAVGWSTADVLTSRMMESGLIAFVGGASGLIAGYVFIFLLGAPGLSDAYLGWSNLVPAFVLVPTLDLDVMVFVLSLVSLPFVAVSVMPAWRAASLDPDRAMRGQP